MYSCLMYYTANIRSTFCAFDLRTNEERRTNQINFTPRIFRCKNRAHAQATQCTKRYKSKRKSPTVRGKAGERKSEISLSFPLSCCLSAFLFYMHIIYRYTTDIFILNATVFVHTIFFLSSSFAFRFHFVFVDFIIIIIMYYYFVLIPFGVLACVPLFFSFIASLQLSRWRYSARAHTYSTHAPRLNSVRRCWFMAGLQA